MSWLSGWGKRIKMTIDHPKVDANLTHFPVTVILSSTHGAGVFSELGSDANRFKIAFTKADGTTQLYAEIEQFDYDNSKAVFHVSKSDWSVSSSADTDFYLYYDSIHADNTTYIGDIGSTPGKAVWDSNFKVVYHMCQDPNGDPANGLKDSTSNANHGSPHGSMTSDDLVDGKVGKGIDFDGSNDWIDSSYVKCFADPDLEVTIEAVIKPPDVSTNILTNERTASGSNVGSGFFQIHADDSLQYGMYNLPASPYFEWAKSSLLVIRDQPNYCAVSTNITSGHYLFQVNGSNEDIAKAFTTPPNSYTGVDLFRWRNYTYGTSYYASVLSEFRISDIPRLAAWLKASYYSLWDTLLTYGSEETSTTTSSTASTTSSTMSTTSTTSSTSSSTTTTAPFAITETGVVFVGQIKNVSFKGASANVQCVGFEHFLKMPVPTLRYQITCNWKLFDAHCKKAKADYKIAAVVTLDATKTKLTSTTFGGQADGYFTGGLVEFRDDSRTIVAHAGNTITIAYRMKDLADNDSVDAWPGCDGRAETCRDKFDNILNFLGFPFIPVENPAIRTP